MSRRRNSFGRRTYSHGSTKEARMTKKGKAKGGAVVTLEVAGSDYIQLPSDSVGTTRKWAVACHGAQKDKDGKPYVNHLDGVALNVYAYKGFDTELLQIAYLHDVAEDCYVTAKRLQDEGYSERVVRAVGAVTKKSAEYNPDYISRVIAGGPDSMWVKYADLRNNTDPDRMAKLTATVQERLKKKYYSAIYRIEQALIELGEMKPEAAWMPFEVALSWVKPAPVKSGSVNTNANAKWKTRHGGRDFAQVMANDKVRAHQGAEVFVMKSKKITTKGHMEITTTDGRVILFDKDKPFDHKWGYASGTYTPSANSMTWHDYLDLPKDWKDPKDAVVTEETAPEPEVDESNEPAEAWADYTTGEIDVWDDVKKVWTKVKKEAAKPPKRWDAARQRWVESTPTDTTDYTPSPVEDPYESAGAHVYDEWDAWDGWTPAGAIPSPGEHAELEALLDSLDKEEEGESIVTEEDYCPKCGFIKDAHTAAGSCPGQ